MRTNKHGYNRKNLDFFFTIILRVFEWTVGRFLMRYCRCCCCCCYMLLVVVVVLFFYLLVHVLCVLADAVMCLLLTQTKWPIDLIEMYSPYAPYVHKSKIHSIWNEMNNDIDDDLFVALSLEINSSDLLCW